MADTHIADKRTCKCAKCLNNMSKSVTIDANHYMYQCPTIIRKTEDGEAHAFDYMLVCKTTNHALKFACSCGVPVGKCVFFTERSRMEMCFFCTQPFR